MQLAVASDLSTEDVAHLYWAVQALDPVVVDLTDESLFARFVRHAASIEVAAWGLVEEVRALQHAQVELVEARPAGAPAPELVLALTAGDADAPTRRSA